MQLCKVQISHSRLFFFFFFIQQMKPTPDISIHKSNTSDIMSKHCIYHLGESPSHLTSMDRLHMRPDGQQQEEQVNMGKQPFSQQISHLFLSDSGFDLFLSFLSLFYIFVCFLSLFNPLLFLDLIVFLLFPPPPPPLQ